MQQNRMQLQHAEKQLSAGRRYLQHRTANCLQMNRTPLWSALYGLMAVAASLTILPACNKDEDDTNTTLPPDNACLVINCPSYFGTTQTFEYDAKRQMTKRSYEFNYPGYSTYVQTVSPTKVVSGYTHNGTLLEEIDTYTGGTGNLYDGLPRYLSHVTHQKNPDGTEMTLPPDSLLFSYDAKKRLAFVGKGFTLHSDNVLDYYTRHQIATNLDMVYDDNDNVIELKQWALYQYGTYVVQAPSESTLIVDSILQNSIKVTYDNKPSPFTASLKYWKFVQND